MGIEETQKLIAILEGDIINLFQIDYEKIVAELEDLDLSEKMKLLVSIGEASLKILVALNGFGLKPAMNLFFKK